MSNLSDVKYAWISPSGEIRECLEKGHETEALRICTQLGIKLNRNWNFCGDALLRFGWIRFSIWGFCYEIDYLDIPNRQFDACFDLAQAVNKSEVWESFNAITDPYDESDLEDLSICEGKGIS